MTLLDDLETVRRRRPSVTVIGDYLLDGWWYGRAERLAREAPAPIVDLTERRYVPGGAANTAVNLAALGAKVRTVGVIGDDEAGRLLLALLQEAEVDVTRLRTVAHLHTTTKIRVSVEEHVLLRLDDTASFSAPDP